MLDPLDYLTAVPGGLAMLGSLLYLWATRRRSPRAAGLAMAGLVGGLVSHFGGTAAVPYIFDHLTRTGNLFGIPVPRAYDVAGAGLNALTAGCLLLVVAAVAADRHPAHRGED